MCVTAFVWACATERRREGKTHGGGYVDILSLFLLYSLCPSLLLSLSRRLHSSLFSHALSVHLVPFFFFAVTNKTTDSFFSFTISLFSLVERQKKRKDEKESGAS